MTAQAPPAGDTVVTGGSSLVGSRVLRREDARLLTGDGRFLDDQPAPTRQEAREAISGNLCRCTGYVNIVSAVQRAAELRAQASPGSTTPTPGQAS